MTDLDLVDYGQQRLDAAVAKRETARGIIAAISARHAVSVDAMTRRHRARRRAHVVLARNHACYKLRAALFTWVEIAGFLGMGDHTVAMRAALAWGEHLKGRSEAVVTEAEGRSALELMRSEGLTLRQAARRMDLSPVKLKNRADMIRAAGKRERNHD